MSAYPRGLFGDGADRLQHLGRAADLLGDLWQAGTRTARPRAPLRLRTSLPVDLARLFELREHVLPFPLGPPPRPFVRHRLQLVDPPDGVVGGCRAPDRPAPHRDPDRVGERLRVGRVERPAVPWRALDPQMHPPAPAHGQLVVDHQFLAVAGELPAADDLAILDQLRPFHRYDAPDPATQLHVGGSVKAHVVARPHTVDCKVDQRPGTDIGVPVAETLEPPVHRELTVRRPHIGPHRPEERGGVQARYRVLAADNRRPDAVAPDGVERRPAVLRARPLDRVGRCEGGVDDEPLGAAEVPLEGVSPVARVHVPGRGPLDLGFQHHVGVAGVEALDCGAFVPHCVRSDQVIPVAEHEHMAVEGGTVLLPDDQHMVRLGERVRPSAGEPELVVDDPVVLVGDLLVEDVLAFGGGHHHQVGQGVVEVAGVVHVDVGGARKPAVVGHVGDLADGHGNTVDLARLDHGLKCKRVSLETAHDGHLGRADRKIDAERPRMMEDPVAGAGDARIGIGGCVELAVGGSQVYAAGHGIALVVQRCQGQRPHGPGPAPLADFDLAQCTAVCLEQVQLGQPALVADKGDPLGVG